MLYSFVFLLFVIFQVVFCSSSSFKKSLVINLDDINAVQFSDYSKLLDFTSTEYKGYASKPAGREHYSLLHYFSKLFQSSKQPFIDIGTRYGTSALTLGALGHTVQTYDIPQSNELTTMVASSLKMDMKSWLSGVASKGGSIVIKKLNLVDCPDSEFQQVMDADLIMLDTYHKPYTVPFEIEFFEKVLKWKYAGLMLLDDVILNKEMKQWNREIVCNNTHGYRVYDLTAVGHATGTALVDFSPTRDLLVCGSSDEVLTRIRAMKRKITVTYPTGAELKKCHDAKFVIAPMTESSLVAGCSGPGRV
jgi:hypothetical protein